METTLMSTKTLKHWTMDEIKETEAAAGHYWFTPGAMRFFRSRVGWKVYQGPGGVFFVSSEQFADLGRGYVAPRRYTVRQFLPDTASVDTVGPFNELTRSAAITAAKHYAEGGAA